MVYVRHFTTKLLNSFQYTNYSIQTVFPFQKQCLSEKKTTFVLWYALYAAKRLNLCHYHYHDETITR